ncbi:MAG: hypothetical protein J0M07_14855 [Anaerolineae bacterium]|nr:hypothetical protein [Anaerolineae bacterium]
MFKKMLIANRGEIAVRIIRTCQEMGIETVALYQPSDRSSLHVRLADQAVQLDSDFNDGAALIAIAQQVGADSLHPGYGFLSEEPDFIRACEQAGVTPIAPPADVLAHIQERGVQTVTDTPVKPLHRVFVQILADQHGNVVHLGEREGSLRFGGMRVIEESPAPCCLSHQQRQGLWQAAIEMARLYNFVGVGSVEFGMNEEGTFFFTVFKGRIQTDHPIAETMTGIDLIREQIRIAAGEVLAYTQDDIKISGCAIACRITAQDPLRNFMPNPGVVRHVRLPGGFRVRVDTYVYDGCPVPAEYDPLVAKVTVWGETREACVARLSRTLDEFRLSGVNTNLSLIKRIVNDPVFIDGCYTADYEVEAQERIPSDNLRDLAVAAAILYARRNLSFKPVVPERLQSGWHRRNLEGS